MIQILFRPKLIRSDLCFSSYLILWIFIPLLFFPVFTYGQDLQTEIKYLSGTGYKNTVEWDFFCTNGRKSGK